MIHNQNSIHHQAYLPEIRKSARGSISELLPLTLIESNQLAVQAAPAASKHQESMPSNSTPKSPKSSCSRGSNSKTTKQLRWSKNLGSVHLCENNSDYEFNVEDMMSQNVQRETILATANTELDKNLKELDRAKQKLIKKVKENMELHKHVFSVSDI